MRFAITYDVHAPTLLNTNMHACKTYFTYLAHIGIALAKSLLIVTIINFLQCNFFQPKDNSPLEFRFAITGNTFAESPFRGKNELFETLVKHLNSENPIWVIHLGDIVHGGKKWMGISAQDLERQYRDVKNCVYKLKPLLFTVKGEKDMLDASSDYYLHYMGRKSHYSFNYGPIHCIVLDNCEEGTPSISQLQINWLMRDLWRNRKKEAIFVFAHYPFFDFDVPSGLTKDECMPPKLAEALHSLFIAYPVKMVISGHRTSFSRTVKDGIEYIVAGCEFSAIHLPAQQRTKKTAQYYVVDYRNGIITIMPRSLD
ncbi:MAG: metallophosphoesterase [Spirochaetes bacterium]|nr:metallophosphoesterase [Spirochaetota bacterium]